MGVCGMDVGVEPGGVLPLQKTVGLQTSPDSDRLTLKLATPMLHLPSTPLPP